MFKVIRLPGFVSYSKALDLQKQLIASKFLSRDITEDYLILLQHEPVIALGRRSHSQYDAIKAKTSIPIIKSPRGGLATYHGPGQLTCYPILDLKRLQPKLSLETYVCDLNHVMTETLQKAYNIQSLPFSSDRVGLWLPGNKKIGFIGIQAQQWLVSHGFSLNLTAECLNGFKPIDPCGLKEQKISIIYAEQESTNRPGFEDVCDILIESFKRVFAIKTE